MPSNSALASLTALVMSPESLPKASASVCAAEATACLELSDSGWFARSLQAV